MDKQQIPYLIVSKEIEFEDFRSHNIFVCLCLIDHTIIGFGTSREQALEDMIALADEKYPSEVEEKEDWESDSYN